MLRDPELREAYEVIRKLPTFEGPPDSSAQAINELISITMLLLRALDKFQDDYGEHLSDLRDTLRQNAELIQDALDRIHRN